MNNTCSELEAQVTKLAVLLNNLSNSAVDFAVTAQTLNNIHSGHTHDIKEAAELSDDITDLAEKVEKVLRDTLKAYLNCFEKKY